jgi:4-hydroxythreonine-4-phosphate dehydrogenase
LAGRENWPPLAVTLGEPAGIGPELTLKAWYRRRKRELPLFFAIGDPDTLRSTAHRLGTEIKIVEIDHPAQTGDADLNGLPVLPVRLEVPVSPGKPDSQNTASVLSCIQKAVEWHRTGDAAAIVTNPIHKATLYRGGFEHPGHTEYLGALCQSTTAPVMMLACTGLKSVPVTIHEALRDAIAHLSIDLIIDTIETTAAALRRDFDIDAPRIAVSGLNPHAGEDGHLGREEVDIVGPALERLRKNGHHIVGPLPADSMFAPKARETYDVAICMTHDQALIPVKALQFDAGVNITLGLPIIRTSPDHGVAFDIAGTGCADPSSLMGAIFHAWLMSRYRARNG